MSGQTNIDSIGMRHVCPICYQPWTCSLHADCGFPESRCPTCENALTLARKPDTVATITNLSIWRRRDNWEKITPGEARQGDTVDFEFNGVKCRAYIYEMIEGTTASIHMSSGECPYTVLELNRTN